MQAIAKMFNYSKIILALLLVMAMTSNVSGNFNGPLTVDERQYLIRLLDQGRGYPQPIKRANAHNIDIRGMSEFKNCYFSPVQCVMDKKK
uniref:Uncharacterized protein n=1 Tax=Rhabditophanes sp. KR3021 TaxID=114890 RepID=A0AC35U915_9BILA